MKTLLLIRHGQASAGTHNYDRLSALGQEQAALVGKRLAELQHSPIEYWSGTLKRQRDSAHIAARSSTQDIALHEHAGLNEYNHKTVHAWYHPQNPRHLDHIDLPTGMTLDIYREIIVAWQSDKAAELPAALEPWSVFHSRIHKAIGDICESSTAPVIALFSSAGVIATLVHHWLQDQPAQLAERIWNTANASLTEVHWEQGRFAVRSSNDFSHLGERDKSPLVSWI